jgi:integrase
MGGKLHVYKRDHGRFWQCSTYLDGRNWRMSTKEEELALAKDVAEDWFYRLKLKHKEGELGGGKTFRHAAAQFTREYEVITKGERSPQYVKEHGRRLENHLLPFFGDKFLSEITSGLVQEYRVHRATSRVDKKTGEPKRPARNTMHQEIVTLRHVLKTARRHQWLTHLIDLSEPYGASRKISHRAWFSPEEYKQLYAATRERAKKPWRKHFKRGGEELHDYVLFMANTGLRPDEAKRLEFRDVAIVTDEATGERILEIEVRGKRGVGYCKSMNGAVRPFERMKKRSKSEPTDLIFPDTHPAMFNNVLEDEKLKFDREGSRRTFYSLRHTYICLRLMEGADIYQIAKNCRTSVEMIEKYYASHIKNRLDAAAINVRRPKPEKKKEEPIKRGKAKRRKK